MNNKNSIAINIDYPLSTLIAEKKKSIEIREFPLPEEYLNIKIVLIETPSENDDFGERVIAHIKFINCFQYKNKRQFIDDENKHHITSDLPEFWGRGDRWGWEIDVIETFSTPQRLNLDNINDDGQADYTERLTVEKIGGMAYTTSDLLESYLLNFLESGRKKQIIFDGVPGTGKTFIAQMLGKFMTQVKDSYKIGSYKFISCHGGMSYEYLFQGLAPSDTGMLQVQKGIFAQVVDDAINNPDIYHAVVFDEINRCNIPQVLGSLLFLLENRGSKYAVDMPYAGQSIYLPENLFIVATMNSDDRSVGILDYAFRRRFSHFMFEPSSDVLRLWITDRYESDTDVDIDQLIRIFIALNNKLFGYDHNFQIGHSYFMTSFPLNPTNLKRLWNTEVLPLLREKFFHMRATVQEEFSLEQIKLEAEVLLEKNGVDEEEEVA